ncbi:MAG TPA: hypothetical protein VGN80_19020 [Devosiaceae bacterium]|jgi:hypothetical protein|nr:hypothetical protein [Devosiaceae bacterium]
MIAQLLVGWKLKALIAAAGLLLAAGIYQTGVNAERARGEAAELRVQIQTLERDRELAERARVSEAKKAAELEAEVQEREEALDALRETLTNRPEADRCPATDADLDLLYQRRP